MGMIGALGLSQAVVDAWRGETVRLAGADLRVPGTRRIRLSVVAGNLRMHRLLDRFVGPGATVVDVGANIGYNAVHAARLAGPRGRVFAVEPTPDNLEVLRRNDLVDGTADVVKIDVEGAELDVLEGMPRLLKAAPRALIVEWHPTLQSMAGYAPDALPRWLLDRGWRVRAVSHTSGRSLTELSLHRLTARLLRLQRPVELLATLPR
jgi:SAM-dependent methyltransferase